MGRRQVLMVLMGWATHVLQWRLQRVLILIKSSQFGLFSATREHEVGITSNRG